MIAPDLPIDSPCVGRSSWPPRLSAPVPAARCPWPRRPTRVRPIRRVQALVAAISVDRLKALDTTLVGFGTRNTLSDQDVDDARHRRARGNWILDELKRSSAKLQVSFDTHQIAPQGRITQPGGTAQHHGNPARAFPASALHQRSLRQRRAPSRPRMRSRPQAASTAAHGDNPAPGANDDGSGTALVIELARAFRPERNRVRRHARLHGVRR